MASGTAPYLSKPLRKNVHCVQEQTVQIENNIDLFSAWFMNRYIKITRISKTYSENMLFI